MNGADYGPALVAQDGGLVPFHVHYQTAAAVSPGYLMRNDGQAVIVGAMRPLSGPRGLAFKRPACNSVQWGMELMANMASARRRICNLQILRVITGFEFHPHRPCPLSLLKNTTTSRNTDEITLVRQGYRPNPTAVAAMPGRKPELAVDDRRTCPRHHRRQQPRAGGERQRLVPAKQRSGIRDQHRRQRRRDVVGIDLVAGQEQVMGSVERLLVEGVDEGVQFGQRILAMPVRLAARRVDDGEPFDVRRRYREARQRVAPVAERLDPADLRPVVLDPRVRGPALLGLAVVRSKVTS